MVVTSERVSDTEAHLSAVPVVRRPEEDLP